MRPPGGPPTRGTVLPTSTAVEENGGKQGLVEVRSSLRELTVLLEPQSDHEASARREEPPDETTDEATAQANLGLLYAHRAEGDRSQNWELAIAAFEDALSALTRESNPEEWAAAQMHLGVAYRDRLAGDRSEKSGTGNPRFRELPVGLDAQTTSRTVGGCSDEPRHCPLGAPCGRPV